MPHVDELLGPATLAAAALCAAIALQPAPPVAGAEAAGRTVAAVVLLPSIEVVARRDPAMSARADTKRKASG